MAICDTCSRDFHWCTSCGTGDDMDEYFCSGNCQEVYAKNQALDTVDELLAGIFSSVSNDVKMRMNEILNDNRDTVGNLYIMRALCNNTWVPYKERKKL